MQDAMNAAARALGGVATRAYALAKGLLALAGLSVLSALVLVPETRRVIAEQVAALAPVLDAGATSAIFAAGPIQTDAYASAQEREQRAVAEFIAKRYRVADEAVAGFVSAAYRAGRQHAVDPLLILAVIAVESRYNPVAESVLGAKGLMQVIPRFHLEKLLDHGGERALLDPDVNIQVGTQILREYLRRFGETETALQMYGGAFDEPTSQYALKVLAEKARLDQLRARLRRQA